MNSNVYGIYDNEIKINILCLIKLAQYTNIYNIHANMIYTLHLILILNHVTYSV